MTWKTRFKLNFSDTSGLQAGKSEQKENSYLNSSPWPLLQPQPTPFPTSMLLDSLCTTLS